MIYRIKNHNILNGILFSIVEFLFTSLVLAPFVFFYMTLGRTLFAAIVSGIILNCLTIVAYGLLQFKHKEKDMGFEGMFNKRKREQIQRANPHLFRETMILVAAILLPFVLFFTTIYEILFNREGV